MEEEGTDSEINNNLYRSKRKNKFKEKARQGKCIGAERSPIKLLESATDEPQTYNHIGLDIWYLISEHIPPEAVQKFALICRDTAAIVRTKKFWGTLFKSNCKKTTELFVNQKLSNSLHIENICDINLLRCRVIEGLFYCYQPFVQRAKRDTYPLEILLRRHYMANWYMQKDCIWHLCYKFSHICFKRKIKSRSHDVEESWELLDKKNFDNEDYLHPHEGVFLLIVLCNNFIPCPKYLLCHGVEDRVRLINTRQKLTKDMRCFNLELDFVDGTSNYKTTVVYPEILKYKVVPWWHPEFKNFMK